MPARSSNTDMKGQPTRQSPRKRKREEQEIESATQAAESPTKTPKQSKKKTNSNLDQDQRVRKHEIVVDEPARTKIASRTPRKDQQEETKANGLAASKQKQKQEEKQTERTSTAGGHTELSDEEVNPDNDKKPRKRKTKEEKAAETMPLAARTTGLNMFVGAHVSIAKGVENAITNSVHIGGNAFALFLQSQRKWENPGLKPENRDAFHKACVDHKYDPLTHVVPHGSYLVNLAAKDEAQAKKSYDFFLGDLKRCEALGIRYYNFHPGATNKEPLTEAITRLANRLNDALAETNSVVPLLENMAGTESIIGSRFSDLQNVISQIKPEYQSRIGICIDTCHAFAAGYDLRTRAAFDKTFQELDEVVGLKYLKAMHLNDSKGMFKSKKDLHQNIGLGFLGLRAFHSIMNEPRLRNVPLILETPSEKPDPKDPKKTVEDKSVWAREIKLLESLIGMDPDGPEFRALEAELSDKGRDERTKMEKWVVDRENKDKEKEEKMRRKLAKAEKGQQSISGMFGGKPSKKKQESVSPSSSSSDN